MAEGSVLDESDDGDEDDDDDGDYNNVNDGWPCWIWRHLYIWLQ